MRAPTPDEATFVDARRRDWHEQVRRNEAHGGLELLVPAGFGALGVVLGVTKSDGAMIVIAGALTAFLVGLAIVARRAAQQRIAASRGPWDPPDGTAWEIEETRVRASAVVCAATDDEDYDVWMTFAVPGADWLFVEAAWVMQFFAVVRDVAREHVTITRLGKYGPLLAMRADGATIPWRGCAGTGEHDYVHACELGFAWRPELDPEDSEGGSMGLVAEASLPDWMRDTGS